MLKSLNFDVTFTTTGKSIKGSHNFELGLSAITGKNEAGKSLRLEMIRFALFGTKALRSEVKNYKSITSEIDFVVNGETYTIKRVINNANLTKGKESLATGTKPVNQAVIKILGYDLEVFDVANNCGQGEIEALTNKTPAERKRMVDRTLGLDAIDAVIKEVSDSILANKKTIEVLTGKTLSEVEEPVKPVIPLTLEQLEVELAGLEDERNELSSIDGQLAYAKVDQPIEPVINNPVQPTVEELQNGLIELEKSMNGVQSQLENCNRYEEMQKYLAYNGKTIEELTDYITNEVDKKWNDYHWYLTRKVEKPEITLEEIEFMEDCFHKKGAKASIHEVHCPSCNNQFQYNIHTCGVVTEQPDWARFEELTNKYNINMASQLQRYKVEIVKYEDFNNLEVVKEPTTPKLNNLSMALNALNLAAILQGFDYASTKLHVTELTVNYNSTKSANQFLIQLRKAQDEARLKYQNQLAKWAEYQLLLEKLTPRQKQLENVPFKIEVAKEQIRQLRSYQTLLQAYNSKIEAQAESLRVIGEITAENEVLSKVKKALTELKPKVKVHLLPSLNRVSSNLISQMTNGARKEIKVDENFEIMVDGQPVNTLSGSGKAVANLAVRLALGMVLTNKVFSVLLADEVDASMDAERAAFTAECLRNLTGTISQVILVSHQEPDADHQIKV